MKLGIALPTTTSRSPTSSRPPSTGSPGMRSWPSRSASTRRGSRTTSGWTWSATAAPPAARAPPSAGPPVRPGRADQPGPARQPGPGGRLRPRRCWPRWPPPSTSSPAGGSTSASGPGWNEAEFLENGLPFPRPGAAGHARGGPGGAAGAAHRRGDPGVVRRPLLRADQAPVVPGPVQRPRPPLWVGGSGDRLLGVVARAADGWNYCWAMRPRTTGGRSGCWPRLPAGRPGPGEVRRSLGLNTLVGTDADDLVARWNRLRAGPRPGSSTRSSSGTGPPPGWSAPPTRSSPLGTGRRWGSSR